MNRPLTFSALGRRAQPSTIARLMTSTLENPSLLSLAAGFTDNITLPFEAVETAVNSIVRRGDKESLQYGMNQGRRGLRDRLTEHLIGWEPNLSGEELEKGFFVTNGSQQALYLAMQVLCEPGDIVLVDRPSYFVYLEMLVGMGLRAVSIPVDANGLVDGKALDATLTKLKISDDAKRLKAVYFVSYYSNPSSRSLSVAEKERVAEALQTADLIVPVIEDAAYRDLYFDEPSMVPSVLTMKAWEAFPQLYLSTLTKPFATGLKVGYGYCTHAEWLAKMLHTKAHHDFGSANFNQAILEEVLTVGGLARQLAVIRPEYARKMRALHEILIDEGLSTIGWKWCVPQGGLYLWQEAPVGIDTSLESEFCQRCIEEGVLYVPGDLCFGEDPPLNYVRLSYGVLGNEDLREAGRRFARVAREFCL